MYKTLRWLFVFMSIVPLTAYPDPFSPNANPIDIVYLWVDGNDPQWLAIKESHIIKASDSYTDNRFNDNEELRYSLRSIWKFAPFVNHIYIVTMNQRPRWLADHPKITVIDHRQIFKNLNDLPTFNSHALESNLHRIPGLNEFFIYFNDDVFLGRAASPFDFFTPEGYIHVLFEKGLSPDGPPLADETAYRRAWRNTNAFLNARFKEERRCRLSHAPFALRKSLIEMAEKDFSFIFESNSSHKFRSDTDFNMVNGLLQYYWLYHGKIVLGTMTNMMVSLKDDEHITHTTARIEKLKKKRPQTFCIQDVMTENSNETRELFKQFLQEYYPNPAPWECN